MKSRRRWTEAFLLASFVACPLQVRGEYTFVLKSYRDQVLNLQFYQTEIEPQWAMPDVEINPMGRVQVKLFSEEPYTLWLTDDDGKCEVLEKVDIFGLAGRVHDTKRLDQDPPVIELNRFYETETQVQNYTVIKSVPETKTRTYTVTRYRKEERTKSVMRWNQVTGKQEWVTETYTVDVPYTESMESTYTVMTQVPETLSKEVTLQVAKWRLTSPNQPATVVEALPVTAPGAPPRDGRRREFGAGVTDRGGEVLVTSVTPNSPATRLYPLKGDRSQRHTLTPGNNTIFEVNGSPVTTGAQMVEALQSSPPSAVIGVRHRVTGLETRYRTTLILHAAQP